MIVTVAVMRIRHHLLEGSGLGRAYVLLLLLLTPEASVQPETVSVVVNVDDVSAEVQMNQVYVSTGVGVPVQLPVVF